MIKRNVKDCVPISFTKISPTVPMDFYLIPKIAGHKNNGMLRRSKYDAYAVPVRSHDTYMCFYTYGSPNKHVVIVSLARSEAQDRNNITLNFEEIWMLSRKNTGLL